ncbi:hypothetical protein AHAS_Ahas10G0007700 [Arachis hypogaea]
MAFPGANESMSGASSPQRKMGREELALEMVEPIIKWQPVPAWLEEIKDADNVVKATIDRYKKACSDSSGARSAFEINGQYYQQEAEKLRAQISNLQNNNRQILGESLSSMNVRDLKNLENKLEKGISKIRSKKNELLFAEIEYMQKREIDLHNNNQLLRAKIAESERNNMSVLPTAGPTNYESMHQSHEQHQHQHQHQQQQFDSRGYFQVTGLQPNSQYARQDQMSLQLV